MLCSRLNFCVSLVVFLLISGISAGAQAPIQTLSNQVPNAVVTGKAALVGPVAAEQHMSVSIVLPVRNQAQLTGLLNRLYDPSSPVYRKFLSVEQFADQFGATAEDYQAVVSFAQANGLTVTGNHANRLVVPVSGTVSQINQAFNVRMNVYQHPTENRTFFSPDREPSLALGVAIAHIAGLSDFYKPKPMLVPGQNVAPQGNVTGSGPSGSYLGSDMRAAYYGGTTLTGIGQTVGLLEFDGYNLSDVNLTFSNAGQSNNVPINSVLLDGAPGGPVHGSDGEQVLDIVQAIGMAPGLSQVRVYIGNNDADILSSMASENIAKSIGCSWSWQPDDPGTDDVFFEEFAAQGQTFFAASGDDGAFDATISPFFYPQEDEFVTAVGGTHLVTSGPGGTWVSEAAWNSIEPGSTFRYGSGGGISPDSIAIPSWQSGLANSSNGGSATLRNVPDVAMEGDFDNYLCELGSCFGDGAGTSFAAPRWAGFMALVNQQAVEAGNATTGGIGAINQAIYSIGAGASYGNDFHDITSGNNDTDNQPVYFNAVSGYDLVTGLGSANGQPLIDALAGPQVPGFWMSASTPNVSLNQGSSSTTTINVTDAGGFSGDVTLAVTSTLPTGVTASWGTNPTSGGSVLTLTSTSTAPAGTTTLVITGTSGTLTQTLSISVAVHTPTFGLTASPSTLSLNQGGSTTSTIRLTPEYGFTGSANLTVTGLPSGVTASWGTNPISNTSVLTLNATSAATPGATTLTVTGTSGSLTITSTLSLTVYAPTFTLSSQGTVNIGQGSSGTATVFINDEYGFTGAVNLSVSGLPAGVTGTFSPNPATGTISTLTLTATSTTSVGSSTVTITGTSGSITATTTLTLGVFTPTFTLSSQGAVNVGQGTTGTTSIYVYPEYGFTGNVTLSVSGLPAGVTATWNPNPTTPNNGSQLALVVSSSAALGQYPLTITGTSGSQTATTNLTLGIYVPTFTLSGGGILNVGQGSSGTSYIYINDEYGFTGSVTFSISGLPTGVTALWNPNPATGSSQLTLAVSSSAMVGQYPLTITGTSGTVSATTNITLGIFAPTFTLYSGGGLNIGQGTSGTTYVDVTPQYGFTGSVNLAVTGLPSGVTASFTPNPTTSNSTLTLTASSTVQVGQYTLTVTGTSGSQSATTTVTIGIFAPTFTLSAGSINIGQGTTTTTSVYVNPEYGFTGSATLTASGLPIGVTAAFSPNPTNGQSTLTLTATSTASLGQYTVTITGISGTQRATTTLTLGVYVPTFTLYGGGLINIGQGSSGIAYVYVSPQFGFNGSVTFTASGLPSGVTASFSPNPATSQTTLTLSASSTASLGQYTVTITGTSGTQTATTTVNLGVYAPTFTLYAGGLNIGQGTTATTYVDVTDQYGFTGSVSLAATGLPSGVTASFAPNPVTGTSSVLTLTASSSAPTGQYTVTITGTSGTQTVSTTMSLGVYAQSFTVYASPNGLTMDAGATSTSTIFITPQYGFNGSVTFSASGLPSGVTASFTPNPATGSSLMTLTASGTATAGNATVAITGTSGSLTASTTVALTVNAPGFTVTDAPSEITLTPGKSDSSNLIVTPQNGFSGSVNFAVTGLPSGVTASFSPNPASLTSTLTLTADSSATAGSATAAITGTSGSLTATTPIVVTVGSLAATTSTTLGITASGTAVTTVVAGTPVTLTAAVNAGATALTQGQVNFCDATATSCTGSHLLGTAQLTSAKLSSIKFIPGIGSHSYKAVFAGTSVNGASSSAASSLAVTGLRATATTIAESGGPGTYTLTAKVAGQGPIGPTGIVSFLDTSNSNASLGSVALANSQSALTWVNSQTPATSTDPISIAVGDFNGDGVPDLAVANQYGSNGLTILLGNGNGTFTAATASPLTGSTPTFVAVGDFNMDGKADLAVANYGSNSVTILLGNGDGTFTPSSLSPQTGAYPAAMTVADFNRDGIPDIAVANSSSNTVTILLGNGDGTFTPSSSAPQTGIDPRMIVAGDFNGDGIPDLAVANSQSTAVTILLGNGDGSFAPAASPSVPLYSFGLAIDDVNLDGHVDLVVGSTIYNTVTVLLGNGDGTFTAASTSPKTGSEPESIAVSDFNGDGKPDLAIAVNFGNSVMILLGNGDGTFTAAQGTATTGSNPVALAVGDFNGDGTPDIATSNYSSNTVSILSTRMTQTATATATGVSDPGPGTQTVEASYPGDSNFQKSVSSMVQLAVGPVAPNIAVVPSSYSVSSTQALTVTVTLTGLAGGPVPTGSITLLSSGYSNVQLLSAGSATFNVPGNVLPSGFDILGATYTPDSAGAVYYSSVSQGAIIAVAVPTGNATATVQAAPSAGIITNLQSDTVTVSVSGASGAPTGFVTLSSGSYLAQQSLSSGSASFTIPAGALSAVSNTVTASYSGDPTYAAATGTTSIVISAFDVAIPAPSAVAPGSSATSTITLAAGSNYSGTVNLTCALMSQPSGAQSLPTCSISPASETFTGGGTVNPTFKVSTTAASTASLTLPKPPNMWVLGSAGPALAFIVLFGIAPRRRRWASMLVLAWVIVVAGGVGCGGGSSSSGGSGGGGGGGGTTTPATTAGSYTFKVTATDSVSSAVTNSVNVTVVVQ